MYPYNTPAFQQLGVKYKINIGPYGIPIPFVRIISVFVYVFIKLIQRANEDVKLKVNNLRNTGPKN